MKLVLVGPAYPQRGGIAHYAALLTRELREKGHEVRVVNFSRQYPSFLFPGKTQDEAGDDPVRLEAEPLVDSIGPLSWFRAAREIARGEPDLVVFQHWMPFFAPAYGTMARRLKRAGIRTCFLLHNVTPHEGRPGDAALTRWGLAPVDAFVAQSDAVADDLRRFRPDAPLARVPHPVVSLFPPGAPRDEARRRLGITARDVALFFGFIREYKGLHDLLEAVGRMPRERDFQLLVAGEFYEDEAPYREAIARLGLADRVVLHDRYVPNEEVGDFFTAANVVVLPYRSATQSGITQIAFHYDKPVILTDVGGLAEIVRPGVMGEVVPPRDPAALAAALERFFAEGLEERYSAAVAVEKERFSWGALVEALEGFAGDA